MEIPESLYNWLKSTGLFSLQKSKDKFLIPNEVSASLEEGHGFVDLIKRMNQLKVTVT